MNHLKPYPAYKDSGVPWSGDVPRHWQVLPGRACYRGKKVPNRGLKERAVLSLSYGQIVIKPEDKLHGLVPASFETYQIVEPKDIIVRPTDLQNDWVSLRFGLSGHRGIITSAYMCFNTQPVMCSEYGHLLLHTYDLKKVFYGLGSGLRQNLDWHDFKYLPCFIPPLPEQTAIVRYLDYMDKRIRRYINAKKKLVALLSEQKQAIIHQAVTRGFDPNVRLKPSGVEWLGDIPEHWEVRRLRNIVRMLVSNVDKHSKEDETRIRLCNYVDVYKNERITENLSFMPASASAEEIARFTLKPGDIIITKDSEDWNDIGVPSLVEYSAEDLVCGYHLAILRPRAGILGEYLLRALQSPSIASQFCVEANGVTRYGLSHVAIKGISVPMPPLHEQTAIVQFLNDAVANFDAATNRAQHEITLLHEYRTRLIADVVTGRLDVREAAASLTEEVEEEPMEEVELLTENGEAMENGEETLAGVSDDE